MLQYLLFVMSSPSLFPDKRIQIIVIVMDIWLLDRWAGAKWLIAFQTFFNLVNIYSEMSATNRKCGC